MALSVDERETFLAEPHVAALSAPAGDRGPLTVPIWYQYAPGAEPWVLTPADSHKTRLIEKSGVFTLMAQRLAPTVRYVSVEGPVAWTRPGTDSDLEEIAHRYLPAEQALGYIEMARAQHGPQVVIAMAPRRWYSADLGLA